MDPKPLAIAGVLCLGLGLILSSSKKNTSELLRRAILVNDLKGLGECLEDNKEIENLTVLVCGTVGSTSTVENSCLGVFIKETMNTFGSKKKNAFGSVEPKSETITVSRKEVPWYLDDGTARVYVCDYQNAKGFYNTLKEYFSTESVITYFKIIHSELIKKRNRNIHSDGKEKMLITDVDCRKCVQVLEIGTYLTVVGRAVRDKDGSPMVEQAYQFFNGHIQLDEFVTDLESDSEGDGTLSFCVMALGAVLLGLSIMQIDVDGKGSQ
ncbi:unnamed protein product [Eruca vesicaria subsp. sativa]|uniref:RING-type E3 ubiquitin transferase n=1 Tax=Eruca vesicaria subsp. sativa TaxID=29727 RepID=A0ABC8M7B4_ERUVS|nr:unnamed protein product [Eruca vesicaria subsp. sativa]